MKRASMLLVTAIVVLAGAQLALAEGETIATYGTGQAAVIPANPKGEASIRAAVTAAEEKTWPLAVANARSAAQAIADATGLTLGAVMSVEQQANPYLFGGFGVGTVIAQSTGVRGPFNGKFCGRVARAIFRTVNGKRKVVRRVRERRCFVPGAVANTLEVTFRAAPKVSV